MWSTLFSAVIIGFVVAFSLLSLGLTFFPIIRELVALSFPWVAVGFIVTPSVGRLYALVVVSVCLYFSIGDLRCAIQLVADIRQDRSEARRRYQH